MISSSLTIHTDLRASRNIATVALHPRRNQIRPRGHRLTPSSSSKVTASSLSPSHNKMESHIPGFLKWIERCNNGIQALESQQFIPLTVEGTNVGYFLPSFAEELQRFSKVFKFTPDNSKVTLAPSLDEESSRTTSIADVLNTLKKEGIITGWRDELYPAVTSFHSDPVFLLERAAAKHFGIKAYGVHINGYVVKKDGTKELWVAKRSKDKPTWPGKLDHIAAGGQPHGLNCTDNVVKECEEEAGIPANLASKAVAVGAVSYTSLQTSGIGRDVLFCYDLELPEDFIPQPLDGEVESFMRLPLDQVAGLIADQTQDVFKDNCNLVIIDFLIRHGYVTPDMKGYCDLLRGLRGIDCT